MLRVSDSAGRMSRLALAPRIVLPSLPPYEVGVPEGVITELNGWPACCPVNACDAPLRTRRHDSGPWWVATAFHVRLFHLPAGRQVLYSMPVYPGASDRPLFYPVLPCFKGPQGQGAAPGAPGLPPRSGLIEIGLDRPV